MRSPIEPTVIRVRVTSNAKRDGITEGKKGVLEISVKEPPEANRANVKVCQLIAEHFSVPRKNVMITKGSESRSKMILVYKR
ncbi:MAG: DUF167 domain-containing protein [Candidatus Pacebacteria bacterium]|nr:DUF167 domain-containing protein [Candidatus Paceibacterota bacterium]MBP9832048.1 DUF167 domain-containing protein [Candidatus Paceibacterota bacterium]